MAGEDFACYLEQVPGCFVGLGMQTEAIDAPYNVHHPRFKADEAALPIGGGVARGVRVSVAGGVGERLRFGVTC